MATVKVQNQSTGIVFRGDVLVLQETRRDAVLALDVLTKAIANKEFQKLSSEQITALNEIRKLLVDLKPKA